MSSHHATDQGLCGTLISPLVLCGVGQGLMPVDVSETASSVVTILSAFQFCEFSDLMHSMIKQQGRGDGPKAGMSGASEAAQTRDPTNPVLP